jgi:hypothetical protein
VGSSDTPCVGFVRIADNDQSAREGLLWAFKHTKNERLWSGTELRLSRLHLHAGQ